MSASIRKGLAIVAAAALAASIGGCSSGKVTGTETGSAQVSVRFAVVADVMSVRLTVSGGSPALSTPIVQTLGGAAGSCAP